MKIFTLTLEMHNNATALDAGEALRISANEFVNAIRRGMFDKPDANDALQLNRCAFHCIVASFVCEN